MRYNQWLCSLIGGAFAIGVLLSLLCSFRLALLIAAMLLVWLCCTVLRY